VEIYVLFLLLNKNVLEITIYISGNSFL